MSQELLTVASLRTDVNESDMGRKSAATQAKAYAERRAVRVSRRIAVFPKPSHSFGGHRTNL